MVVNNWCLSRIINDTCAPISLFTVTVSTRECPSLSFSFSKQIPHYVLKLSYWSKFKFGIPHWPNLSFWKLYLMGWLIQFSRPQTYVNKHFGVARRHSYWKNYVLKVTKVSDFTTKNGAVKLQPTWQLTDVLSKFKLLNAFTAFTLPAVP
jgi:hypothetical protein